MIPIIKHYLENLDQDQLFDLMKRTPRFRSLVDRNENNKFDSIDWYLPTEDLYIEGKCRKNEWDQYLIEKHKYDHLIQNKNCWYVSTGGNGIYAWDLHHLKDIKHYQMHWVKRWCNETTQFGETKRIQKLTDILHIADAKEYLHTYLLMYPTDKNYYEL